MWAAARMTVWRGAVRPRGPVEAARPGVEAAAGAAPIQRLEEEEAAAEADAAEAGGHPMEEAAAPMWS
jgi:hypothetical protein